MEVSVIIVNYKTKDLTINCIQSIYEYTNNINYEIIVVDNNSADGSVDAIKEKFPSVIVIESDQNLGFGKANNLGTKYSKGKYLFFLNSDCILIENTIKKMFDYFEYYDNEGNRIGVIGGMLLDIDHRINTSYHKFSTPSSIIKTLFISRINSFLNTNFKLKTRTNYKLNENNEVDFITGADLFIPNNTFKMLNGFDPIFFMYYEESDLQKRMEEKSLKRIILDNVYIIHLGGGSNKGNNKLPTIITDSQFKFIKKHYSSIVFIVYYFMMFILFIPTLLNKKYSKKERTTFYKMLTKNSKHLFKL